MSINKGVTMRNYKNSNGFTLAELMITLTIIGVIAALILPSLLDAVPEQTIVMFKKAHSVLEQTFQTLTNNSELFTDGNLSAATNKSGKSLCFLFANEVNTVGTVSCSSNATSTTPSFTTTDGVVWYFTQNYNAPIDTSVSTPYDTDTGAGTNFTHIVVDVNGDKVPNCGAKIQAAFGSDACANGSIPDRFMFAVRYDGKITVLGTEAN